MLIQWQKPLQSIVAIFITWAIGYLIAQSSIFASTLILRSLSLADLALFFARITILILLLVLARQLQTVLPDNGKGSSFLRAIVTPLATLFIVMMGQDVLLEMLDPFLSFNGERNLILFFWLIALACTGWLIWVSYLHGPELVAGIIASGRKLSQLKQEMKICPACGAHVKSTAKFCSHCGTHVVEKTVIKDTSTQREAAEPSLCRIDPDSESDIPQTVREKIRQQFPNGEINAVEIVVNDNDIPLAYEVSVSENGKAWKAYFNADGSFINKVKD